MSEDTIIYGDPILEVQTIDGKWVPLVDKEFVEFYEKVNKIESKSKQK